MFGVDDSIIRNIKDLLSKYDEIEKAYIFGSRARGDYKSTSDIDIAIFSLDISSTILNLIRDDMYMIDTIYKIDIVHFESLTKEKLQYNILNEGIIIYKK